jgi:hypothetical protein
VPDDFDLDDDDDLDDPEAEASLAVADVMSFLAGRPDPTRRDLAHCRHLLRDASAGPGVVLEALVEAWEPGIAPQGLDGLYGLPCTPDGVSAGRCPWPGCTSLRKERAGPVGRLPARCETHIRESKLKQDRDRQRAIYAGTLTRRPCCADWKASGRRKGKCPQCREGERAARQDFPLSAVEAAYLAANGFHLV